MTTATRSPSAAPSAAVAAPVCRNSSAAHAVYASAPTSAVTMKMRWTTATGPGPHGMPTQYQAARRKSWYYGRRHCEEVSHDPGERLLSAKGGSSRGHDPCGSHGCERHRTDEVAYLPGARRHWRVRTD